MSRKVTGKVVLQGLEFHARHGVFEVEGVLGARFVVDAELHYPFAHIPDELEAAVNYAEVYELIREEVTERQHQLIEVLAAQVARRLLTEQPKLQKVTVRVHKPFAPVAGIFRDIYAELELDREELELDSEELLDSEGLNDEEEFAISVEEYMRESIEDYEILYREVKKNKNEVDDDQIEEMLRILEEETIYEALSKHPKLCPSLPESHHNIYREIIATEEKLAEETGVLFNHNDLVRAALMAGLGKSQLYSVQRLLANDMLYQYATKLGERETLQEKLKKVREKDISSMTQSEEIALKISWIADVMCELDQLFTEGRLTEFLKRIKGNRILTAIIVDRYGRDRFYYQRRSESSLSHVYLSGVPKYQTEVYEYDEDTIDDTRDKLEEILSIKKQLLSEEITEIETELLPLLTSLRRQDLNWSKRLDDGKGVLHTLLSADEDEELPHNPHRLAYIALGANLGDPLEQLRWAREQLQELGLVIGQSCVYRTKPLGVQGEQPDYNNAAVLLQTLLSPRELLTELHRLEAEAGRVRTERWEARPLDLDMIAYYYADGTPEISDDPVLILPHPRAWERTFVLFPLADMNPSLTHPVTGETLEDGIKKALGDEAQRDIVQIKEFRWLSREEDDDEFLEDELEEDPEND